MLIIIGASSRRAYVEHLQAVYRDGEMDTEYPGSLSTVKRAVDAALICRDLRIPYVVLSYRTFEVEGEIQDELEIVDRNVDLEALADDTGILIRSIYEPAEHPELARFCCKWMRLQTCDDDVSQRTIISAVAERYGVDRSGMIEPLVCPIGNPSSTINRAFWEVSIEATYPGYLGRR